MNKTLLLLAVTAAMDPSVRKVPGSGGLLSIAYQGPRLSLSTMAEPQAASTPVRLESSKRHDVEFWKRIRERNFAVPDGESVDTLLLELAEYTGSADPELRDDLAYGIAAAWIYRDERASDG